MKSSLLTFTLLTLWCGSMSAQDYPKADLFFGYSFLRANQAQSIPAFTANGGVGTLGWNFTNHIALEAELGGYHNGNVNNYQFDTTTFSYLFGPRLSYGRSKRFDPYVHVLWGGSHGTTSIASSSILVVNPPIAGTTVPARYSRSQNTFAMAAGGGIDLKLSRHLLLRPIQLDYYLTRYEAIDVTQPAGSSTSARNQNNLRYATGIAFTFGGETKEPPPPAPRVTMKSCPDGSSVKESEECPKRTINLSLNVDQREICPGAVARITPTSPLPNSAVSQWTVNGEPAGQGLAYSFGSTGRAPGTYRIGLKMSSEGFNDASAETTVTVRAYQPPTGTLRATPAEIFVGEKSTLTPNFAAGQCGGPLSPATFTTSEGSVSGTQYDSTGVSFDPSQNSEQRKTVTVTARVSDSQGAGTAPVQLVVKKAAAITAKRLPDVIFPTKSARVNNCGKRVLLEELKASTDRDPTGTVVLIGHQSDADSTAGLDLTRALNAAAVISAGQGVCTAFPARQITIGGAGTEQTADFQPRFCGTSTDTPERAGQTVSASDDSAKLRRVEVWFVPTNGKMPDSLKNPKDAVSANVASLGCPR
jgi:opacity protein-like surface antigen